MTTSRLLAPVETDFDSRQEIVRQPNVAVNGTEILGSKQCISSVARQKLSRPCPCLVLTAQSELGEQCNDGKIISFAFPRSLLGSEQQPQERAPVSHDKLAPHKSSPAVNRIQETSANLGWLVAVMLQGLGSVSWNG